MKVLGLDIGTNSIGWGIVDENKQKIEKCGVYIFPEGVKIEKGNECSKAAERTRYRSARRMKFRRKLRKYETLKVLIKNEMCPLTLEELEKWRREKTYPISTEFVKWYRTDEENNWEPYFLRKKCAEQKVEKYELGRALYHIAQRRGFLSNRKETTKETDGKVSSGIDEITKAKGDKTLGQYFYELKQAGEKVRGKYTARKLHYESEFNKICEVQGLSENLKDDLYKAIFFQRKLKSQKFLVGKCTLEPNKPRCPISHFEFEEFRMLSFINSIKVAKNNNEDDNFPQVALTDDEKELIVPLFFRSKPNFEFKDISKKLRGKNDEWQFNYRDDANVCGCPVSTSFKNIFGESWKDTKIGQYDIYDIWHVLFDFDDEEKLHEFALNKLNLNSELADKFCAIHLQQGYANLSLKAIRKILPFLRKGYIYSHAAFLANIPTMIGKDVYEANAHEIEEAVKNITSSLKDKNNIITLINRCLDAIFKDSEHDFHSDEWDKSIVDNQINDLFGKRKWTQMSVEEQANLKKDVVNKIEDSLKLAITKNPNDYKYPAFRTDKLIEDFLNQKGFVIKKNAKLYHPSDTEYGFEPPVNADDGKVYLGSPRTASVKNPVAMRALFQLRRLINYLIKTGEIDSETRVHIELANEVNDKNWRKAIEEIDRENMKENEKARARLHEEFGNDFIVTDEMIKKFRLWSEQSIGGVEICPYTGKTISITDLFGEHPTFDFEHTIPRSLSYDDSLENLTLCDSEFNRKIKKQHIPSELSNYKEIKDRFLKMYEGKIEECLNTIERNKIRGGYIDPDFRDRKIVARHKAQLKLDYYKGKVKRFTATEVTSGFKHSQLNDTRIITKFALSYIKPVFPHTFPVKGSMTDTFKRQWGLLDRDENKDRSNYRHHAIDALTVACIDRRKFNLLSEAIRASADGVHLNFCKPWQTFDKDVLDAVQYIIPKHSVDDNSLRQSKKVLRDRSGKPVLKDGKKVYIQGDTARGSLHKDTFYGCIMTPPEKGIIPQKVFVQRVSCDTLSKDSADKIIDKGIRNTFINNLESGKQTIAEIQTNGILLPYKINGKEVFAKRVRIRTSDVKNPIQIKKHKEETKEYKTSYYVKNEENYLIALYRGRNEKEKVVSDYLALNLLDAVHKRQKNEKLYPTELKKKGTKLSLYKVLKNGKIVILQKSEDEDVFSLSKEELFSRVYRIFILESDGRVNFAHTIIQEAKNSKNKNDTIMECIPKYKRISSSGIFCLVEGEDFIITPTGEIVKKESII